MTLRSFASIFCKRIKSGDTLLVNNVSSTVIVSERQSHILKPNPNPYLKKPILEKYAKSKWPGENIEATYLWDERSGDHIRLRHHILDLLEQTPELEWENDGSSAHLAHNENSYLAYMPRFIHSETFKPVENYNTPTRDPNHDDKRDDLSKRIAIAVDLYKIAVEDLWFGVDQEYTLLGVDLRPFVWPMLDFSNLEGVEYDDISIEETPIQLEYQDEPNIDANTPERVAKELGVAETLEPKRAKKQWNGNGAHANFSNKNIRENNELTPIEVIANWLKKH